MYLKLRGRVYWAYHDIPASLQAALAPHGVRFRAALGTENKTTAHRLATVLYAGWLAEIEQARKKTTGPDETEKLALSFRRSLRAAPEDQKEFIRDQIGEHARSIIDDAAIRKGIQDDRSPEYEALPEQDIAGHFIGIATGETVKLDEHLPEWIATLSNVEEKTRDMREATVLRFTKEFPYLHEVRRKVACCRFG